jgi:hypothetical protein
MEKSKNVTLQGTLALLVLKSLEQAACTPGASRCTSPACPGMCRSWKRVCPIRAAPYGTGRLDRPPSGTEHAR